MLTYLVYLLNFSKMKLRARKIPTPDDEDGGGKLEKLSRQQKYRRALYSDKGLHRKVKEIDALRKRIKTIKERETLLK